MYVLIEFTETQIWSKPNVYGSKPAQRDGHSACVLNDCMYIFGGFQERTSLFSQDLYMLNLNNMMWSTINTMVCVKRKVTLV